MSPCDGRRLAAALAGEFELRRLAGERQHAPVDQRVVDDDVGLRQRRRARRASAARVAGPGAGQPDMAGREAGHVSAPAARCARIRAHRRTLSPMTAGRKPAIGDAHGHARAPAAARLDDRRLRRRRRQGGLRGAADRRVSRSRSRSPCRGGAARRPSRSRRHERGEGAATAGVVKDAGDDPDVTHGALVVATVRRGAAGARRHLPRRRGRRHGHAARPADPAGRAGDQSGAAPDDRARRSREVAAATGQPGDVEVEISDPRRRGAGREDAQSAARHRRRHVDPRHDRHRRALFLLGLDPLHPSRHRRRARHGPHPCRRRDRRRLRGRRAEAARPARGGADRHGRFRRRHAEICPRASRAARHHRRRRRQDDQARAGPARPAFRGAARSTSTCWPRSPTRPAASPRLRARIRAANTVAEAFAHAPAEGVALGDAVARAALGHRRRRRSPARDIAARDRCVFDREGRLVGHAAFRAPLTLRLPAAKAALIVGVVERALAEILAPPARGRPRSSPCARSARPRAVAAMSPSVPRMIRSSGQVARNTTATGQSAP